MKPTTTSRADLLRCMGQGLEPDAAAVILGYVRVRETESAPLPQMPQDSPVPHVAAALAEAAPVTEMTFPTERPRLTFLMPVRVESLAPPQPRRERGNPITDAALAVDWSQSGPPLPPLTRWARLAPFLRSRLGAIIPGAGLDERRLMKQVGKGLPLAVLPRRPRQSWAAQAVVLWDATEEMHPFQRDARALLRRLRRERGPQGLDVRLLRRLPRQGDAARIPQGVPVLALSAMGQFQQSQAAQEAWLGLARRLGFLGYTFHALNPCPRDRWQPQTATHWPSAVWDRRPRLPRRGGLRATVGEVGRAVLSPPQLGKAPLLPATERLLMHLSPASRIEAPLLRTARLALGHTADAGTEWDAWQHEQCWHSLDSFGFHPGADYEARLNQRQALTGREAELAEAIGSLMAAHHAGCSSVIAAEAALRAILSFQKETPQEKGTPQRSDSVSSPLRSTNLSGVKSLLQSVVDRLRLLAADPGGEEGRQSGLPGWFPGMVERLSESMRADVEVKKLIAEGLAYAHTYLETEHTELPLGVDGEIFRVASNEVAVREQSPLIYRVEFSNAGLSLVAADSALSSSSWQLTSFRAQRREFFLSDSEGRTQVFHPPDARTDLLLLAGCGEIRDCMLASDRERIHFKSRERPSWAKRVFWGAGRALHAEAEVEGQVLSLIWSPEEDLEPILDDDSWDGADVTNWSWECTTHLPKWADRLWADDYGLAATFHIRSVPFTLRWIPPVSFLMGSPEGEPGRYENEGPQHRVAISKGYWMAETPVTQGQWRAVVEAAREDAPLWQRLFGKQEPLNPAPSHFQGQDELPVEQVSWEDSRTFCQMLNALLPDGPGFHLPTEAQWEYACRAGKEPQVPFNGPIRLEGEVLSPDLEDYAWYGGNSGKDCAVSNPQDSSSWLGKEHGSPTAATHPVKLKRPNPYGLHDMLGNVWEWCADAWDETAYAKRADGVKDPRMDSTDESARRVVRGGSWGDRARFCRAAFRDGFHPGNRWGDQGLRLAAGQEPGAAEQPLPERRSRARRAEGRGPA